MPKPHRYEQTVRWTRLLPFYRQSVMYARDGVEIEAGTMGHWLGSLTWLLNPLVDAVRRHALGGIKVHTDDTPLPVLAPGNGRTKTGRLWVYVRDDRCSGSDEAPAVWFAYTPDRRGEHPQRHLANFTGVLLAEKVNSPLRGFLNWPFIGHLGQESGGGPDADSRHAGQDLPKRVRKH